MWYAAYWDGLAIRFWKGKAKTMEQAIKDFQDITGRSYQDEKLIRFSNHLYEVVFSVGAAGMELLANSKTISLEKNNKNVERLEHTMSSL